MLSVTVPHLAALAPQSYLQRLLADSTDRVAWLKARATGVTATDAAKLTGPASVARVVHEKAHGSGFTGNAYTDHGKRREPVIAAWAQQRYGIEHSTGLFHAAERERHLATPDGIGLHAHTLVLEEIKTSTKPITAVPRTYLRQIWWQQYVMGAERTLLVWEQHERFRPVDPEPRVRWIERDEREIAKLIPLADQVLESLANMPETEYF